jgi:hypothetical protein
VKILLFLGLFFFSTLFANEALSEDLNESSSLYEQKVLYLSYEKIPQRVIQGEVFPITIKTLSTIRDYIDVSYELIDERGLKILNQTPYREEKSKYIYDTFYFSATASDVRLPDFKASLIDGRNIHYKTTTLAGQALNVITLNPTKNFSQIIADSFELIDYKTTTYDNEHNIVIFVARAFNADLNELHLNSVFKQGIESLSGNHRESKVTYYAVIDKKIEDFTFSYFNLNTNNFSLISIPIIVDDDSVTTQSDLKPTDQSKERLKVVIAASVVFLGLLLFVWRRKYIYLLFTLLPLAYIAFIIVPSKDVCIKAGTNIYLLPVHNGTIFETTKGIQKLQKEGSIKGFVKVKLENERIGWVEDENICSY